LRNIEFLNHSRRKREEGRRKKEEGRGAIKSRVCAIKNVNMCNG